MTQSIPIPHVLWLLLAIALFAIGIGSSVWAGVVQRRQLAEERRHLADAKCRLSTLEKISHDLPDLDITEAEVARAAALTGIKNWTRKQLEEKYRETMTIAYCRTRHLRKAIAQRDAYLVGSHAWEKDAALYKDLLNKAEAQRDEARKECES